jgi:hypothetical protein
VERDFIDGRSATANTLFFALALILLSALTLFSIWYRHTRVVWSANPWFLWLWLAGHFVAVMSVWALLQRPTPRICEARAYLSNVGFVAVVSPVLARVMVSAAACLFTD